MGMISSSVKFDFPGLTPEMIARQASEICGLAIRYECHKDPSDDVHDFSGKLFFESTPGEKVEIYSYQPRAVQQLTEKIKRPDQPTEIETQGHTDTDGVQKVYVNTYLGCELTLFYLTTLALVKLGGRSERELSKLSEHDKILTAEELQARFLANRKQHRKYLPLYIFAGLFFVLTIPFHILWAIVTMPFELAGLRRKHPKA